MTGGHIAVCLLVTIVAQVTTGTHSTVGCYNLPTIVSGYITYNSTNSFIHVQGSTATYSCNKGYALSRNTTRTCGSYGRWSGGSAPTCKLVCSDLYINNGVIFYSSGAGLILVRTIALYICNNGYTLSGSNSRTCGSNGEWSGSAPICNAVDCGNLDNPANGHVNTSSETTFGSTATYSCNTGYTVTHTSRSCGSDGEWSGSAPVCHIVDCGNLDNPANGKVNTSSGTTFGSTATYSCNTGYALNGSNSRTCGSNGEWSGPAPICHTVDCGPLGDPPYGKVNISSGTTVGSIATYSCDIHFSLIGNAMRTCGSNGVWSGSTPICDEQKNIQLKFGPTSYCLLWNKAKASTIRNDIRQKLHDVITKSNRTIPLDHIKEGVFSCRSSKNYTTFRATISGSERTNAAGGVAAIVEWAEPGGTVMQVEWYLVDVMDDNSCPVAIDYLSDTPECREEPQPTV